MSGNVLRYSLEVLVKTCQVDPLVRSRRAVPRVREIKDVPVRVGVPLAFSVKNGRDERTGRRIALSLRLGL